MAWIRISLSLLTFALLSQISIFFLPILTFFTNWIVLVALSWFTGVYLTRKFVLSRLPSVNPRGRAVLITGCDHGLGYLAAIKLSEMGFHVFAGCLNANGNGAKKLQVDVGNKKLLTILQLDVTKPEEIAAVGREVRDKIEKGENGVRELYALINNAGIMLLSPIETATVQDYERQFAVNTFGPVHVTRALLPLLRRSQGRIITVSSIAARIALGNLIPYSMTKAATSKFVEGLQVELSRFGIKSISIEPWAVRTNLVLGKHLIQGLQDNRAMASDEIKSAYGQGFVAQVEKTSSLMQNFSLNTTEEMVIRDIVDAVNSPEPELVYRVIKPAFAWFFWLEDDYLPWHIVNTLRWLGTR